MGSVLGAEYHAGTPKKSRQMKKSKCKKKVVLGECSECHEPFDVDELKIYWAQYRLLCPTCYQKESVTRPSGPKDENP